MPWAFRPHTYDGTAIDDLSTYHSYFEFPDRAMRLLRRRPIEVPVPGDSSYADVPRAQPMSAEFKMTVEIRASLTDAAIVALRTLFDRLKGFKTLVIEDGTPATWNISVMVTAIDEIDPSHFEITFYTNRPYLESVTTKSDAEAGINASPTTWTLSPQPAGTSRAYPLLTIAPTAGKSDANDYTRRYQVTIAWRSDEPGEDSVGNAYPIDIADGTLDTAAEVAAGRMQADGDDLRVLVDGTEYPRNLVGINTANTKVWVPIHFSPGKQVSLEAAASGSSPATGTGTWHVESVHSLAEWPERGSFIVDSERVWYGSRTDTAFSLLERGYANTTAAAHAAGALADWVEHEIDILTDYSAAANPPTAAYSLDLTNSSNINHRYANFLAGLTQQRYGQWAATFTEDNLRSAGLSLVDSTTLFMVDTPPGGDNYPFNNAELYVPCGVKAAAAALAFDITDGTDGVTGSDVVLNARVYATDVDTGVERLLATYDKPGRGAGKTITPDVVYKRLRLNAIYRAICGMWRSDTPANHSLANTGHGGADETAQGFFFNEHTRLNGIALYAKENAGADTREAIVWIRRGGATPATSDDMFTRNLVNSKFATTYRWVCTDAMPDLMIPSGAHYLMMVGDAVNAGTIIVGSWEAGTQAGSGWDENAGSWTDLSSSDFGFLLLGDGSQAQNDAPGGLAGYLAWDNFDIDLDNATPRTPKIVRSAREDNIYVIRGTIRAQQVAKEITVFFVGKVGESLSIDCGARTVYRNASSLRQFYPGAISPSDLEEWIYLNPQSVGSQQMRWTETGIGTVTITTAWQDVFA